MANRQLMEEGKRYCPGCKSVKELTEFSTTRTRLKIAAHCKECSRAKLRIYHETPKGKEAAKTAYMRNKRVYKNQHLMKRFGITLDEYENKLTQQSGGCAICQKTPEQNKKMLAVDHDHITGKNRDLLCASCNILIGFIEKNKLDFSSISRYLSKHEYQHQISQS